MNRALVACLSVATLALSAAFGTAFAGCSSSSSPSNPSAASDADASDASAHTVDDAGSGDAAPPTTETDAGDSGPPVDPVYSGSETCAKMLAEGWDLKATPSTFGSKASYDAYVALNKCACTNPIGVVGCSDICDQFLSGSPTPNFCNGAAMLANCRYCVQGVGQGDGQPNLCGDVYDACNAN